MIKTPVDRRVLNVEQKAAVVFGEGPLLIIAGAGTGKTTVVTERIKYLITSDRAKPEQILALTFTEKASREMEERVDMALPYGVTQMWISTFHAFCDRVLRAEAINIGLDPAYHLMTEAETILFFRKNLFEFNLKYFRPLGNPTKFITGMLQHFSRLKDEDVDPSQYFTWVKSEIRNPKSLPEMLRISKQAGETNPKLEIQNEKSKEEIEKYFELANAYRTYEELKAKEGVADYADLISNTIKLFRMRPDVLKRYHEQFKYILVDEFQDTNIAQNELAKLLAGKLANITVVADDDQSVYKWRGAAVSNVLQFRKTYPKATLIILTKNYRSTQTILDTSYQLIQYNNPDRLEGKEGINKKLISVRGIRGEQVKLLWLDRVENEAEEVAKQVKSQKSKVKSDGTEYEWKDFAILVRANNHAEPFVWALSRAGIPYQFLGPGQLFRQPEVKDLIAYLKVLYNFEDNVAMYRVLTMDWLVINSRDVAAIVNHAKKFGLSIFETCEILVGLSSGNNLFAPLLASRSEAQFENVINGQLNSNNDSVKLGKRSAQIIPLTAQPKNIDHRLFITDTLEEKIKKLVEMIHRHLGLIKKETAGQILYYFLQESGLLRQFASYKTIKEERVATNIARFFDKLKTYETDHDDASVFTVVDWIDMSMELGESPLATDLDWTENNAVNILTVHSSKGLEFPVVFLVNMVSARFPTIERREQIPIPDALIKEILPQGDYHLEEERRLFYVGMTRARDVLYFSAANFYGEGKREKKLSPFIAEALGEAMSDVKYQISNNKTKQLILLDWEKHEEKEETKKTVTPINYLSYSQLETFSTCPLQYKYRYILRIPVPASAALTFGDTIHRTIKAFYELVRSDSKPDQKNLLEIYKNSWSSLGYGDKKYEEKMRRRGEELLRAFYDKSYDPDNVPLSLEQPFRIKITPLLKLGGKIDRVDALPDGKIEIIDYKTGQAPKTRKAGDDKQLTVYALAATEKGIYDKKPEDVVVSFYFFEGQEKISATRTSQQLAQARKEIAQKAEEISKSNFRPTPGKYCDFCEFRLICEAWQ